MSEPEVTRERPNLRGAVTTTGVCVHGTADGHTTLCGRPVHAFAGMWAAIWPERCKTCVARVAAFLEGSGTL